MTGITNAKTVRIHRLLWVDQQANYARIATATRKLFRCAKNDLFFDADWEKYTDPIVNFGLTKGSTETLWEWTNLHISVLIVLRRVQRAKHEGRLARGFLLDNSRTEDVCIFTVRQLGGIDLLSTD